MPQLHLTSDMVNRIIKGNQTSVLYPALADNIHYKCDDIIIVREPWSKDESGDTIYKADGEYSKKMRWKPSIFMEASDVRLSLRVITAEKIKISSISSEDVHKYGHDSLESLHREWNINLPKEKRPKLGTKQDPIVWKIEFIVDKLETRN